MNAVAYCSLLQQNAIVIDNKVQQIDVKYYKLCCFLCFKWCHCMRGLEQQNLHPSVEAEWVGMESEYCNYLNYRGQG